MKVPMIITKKHGFGTHIWKNKGSTYRGNWEHNLPHGHGRYEYENGDVYEGEFNKGNRHGNGKLVYASGDIYEGEYIDDLKHGNGKFLWIDGDSYHGEFVRGVPEGTGEYIWAIKNSTDKSTPTIEEKRSKSQKQRTKRSSGKKISSTVSLPEQNQNNMNSSEAF